MSSRIPSYLMEQMLQEGEEKETGGVEMVIQLDSSRQCSLLVRPTDDPDILAKKFCFEHNVDPRIIPTLASNIRTAQYPLLKEDTTHDQTMRGDVFQRLYQDGRRRSLTSKQAQKQSHNTSQSACVQQTIYQKNTKLKEAEEIRRSKLRQEQEEKQQRECWFKPRINEISNLIASKMRYKEQTPNMSTMLRAKQYLAQKQHKQMQECTFRPILYTAKENQNRSNKTIDTTHNQSINHKNNSVYVSRNVSRCESDDRCIQLYERGRQMSKVVNSAVVIQKPQINKLSQKLTNGTTFMQRLVQDEQKRKQNKQILQAKVNKSRSKDRIPSTGRPPRTRSRDKPIGVYLYEQSKHKPLPPPQQTPKVFVNPRSSTLYEQSKVTAFKHLFRVLDSDGDGSISGTDIDITDLTAQTLKLIAPLLSEMEECAVVLSEGQFFAAISRLFETLSPHEKNIILSCHKAKIEPEQETFQPMLNEYSLAIAEERREGDLYEIGVHQEAERENKLNQLRAIQLLEEYQKCTFVPNIRR